MKNKKIKIIAVIVFILIGIAVLIFMRVSETQKSSEAEKDKKVALNENNEIRVENIVEENDNKIKENIEDYQNDEELMQEEIEESVEESKSEYVNLDSSITLNGVANSVAYTYSDVTRIEYGTSYQGRPLEAYLITGNGANSKTIFMECEVHGFEDEYYRDGKVLVDLGNALVEYYGDHPDLLGDYRMIIVPSANPDGVIAGTNNTRVGNGYCFGRCTAGGVDINRDFKNGSFLGTETRALRDLMAQYPMNVHIDFHGWENSVIGDETIVNAFLAETGIVTNKSGRWGSGQGYVIEYTKNTYGAHSAIVEFINSGNVFYGQVENALNRIMQEL